MSKTAKKTVPFFKDNAALETAAGDNVQEAYSYSVAISDVALRIMKSRGSVMLILENKCGRLDDVVGAVPNKTPELTKPGFSYYFTKFYTMKHAP